MQSIAVKIMYANEMKWNVIRFFSSVHISSDDT